MTRTATSDPPSMTITGASAYVPVHLRRAEECPIADPASLGTRDLLAWMFSFLRPVKWNVALACLWLALFCMFEVLAVRQSGIAVTRIQGLEVVGDNRPP